MAAKRSSLSAPSSRRRFVVKRVSVVPPVDIDDDEEQEPLQDDEEAVEKPTFYERSLRRMTRETLPQIHYYRNSLPGGFSRPDLDELHNAEYFIKELFEAGISCYSSSY